MSKKVVVTITETKRAKEDQPWKVRIQKPGKAEPYDLPRRYSRLDAGRRGALRNLKAVTVPRKYAGKEWNFSWGYAWQTPEGVVIEFVIKRRK